MEKINHKKVIGIGFVIPYDKKYKYVKYSVYKLPMFTFYLLKWLKLLSHKSFLLMDILIERNTKIISKRVKEFIDE